MKRSAVICAYGCIAFAIGVQTEVATAQAPPRASTTITCKPAEAAMIYDCTIALKDARTGVPIDNAEIVVGADMPSMPMAHNVKPVAAAATGSPGAYAARLAIEMLGDWAVHVTVNAPFRDKAIQVLAFSPTGATEAKRSARPAAPGSKHHH